MRGGHSPRAARRRAGPAGADAQAVGVGIANYSPGARTRRSPPGRASFRSIARTCGSTPGRCGRIVTRARSPARLEFAQETMTRLGPCRRSCWSSPARPGRGWAAEEKRSGDPRARGHAEESLRVAVFRRRDLYGASGWRTRLGRSSRSCTTSTHHVWPFCASGRITTIFGTGPGSGPCCSADAGECSRCARQGGSLILPSCFLHCSFPPSTRRSATIR